MSRTHRTDDEKRRLLREYLSIPKIRGKATDGRMSRLKWSKANHIKLGMLQGWAHRLGVDMNATVVPETRGIRRAKAVAASIHRKAEQDYLAKRVEELTFENTVLKANMTMAVKKGYLKWITIGGER